MFLLEHDPDSKAQYENLAKEYLSRLLPAIEDFKVTVTSLDAIFKLSQNHSMEHYDNIILKLNERQGDSILVAAEMVERRVKVFAD